MNIPNLNSEFDKIRPYNNDEIPEAMQRIADAHEVANIVSFLFPEMKLVEVRDLVRNIETTEEFQKLLAVKSFQKIVKQTTKGVTVEGFENIDTSKNHMEQQRFERRVGRSKRPRRREGRRQRRHHRDDGRRHL